ncbi:hypothetical protein VTP01DRAFT_5572 [Rhizomucor pusillus]|uniref:uncharacterized protein n=1 Tax=Rhizomucor pusillus TaxID=4840 RepID=UPI003742B66D
MSRKRSSGQCMLSTLIDVDRSGPESRYEMQWTISIKTLASTLILFSNLYSTILQKINPLYSHTMTMCKGEGGNHALQDAAELGPLLADVYEAGKPLEEAVQEYYDSMIPRAQKAVKESHDACFFMHRPKREQGVSEEIGYGLPKLKRLLHRQPWTEEQHGSCSWKLIASVP